MSVKPKQPLVRRRFARCKITLMKVDYSRKTIRITLKPSEYVEISYAHEWSARRVRDWKVGEAILKDNRVIIPFKRENTYRIDYEIAWDCNEKAIDGFSPQIGFIHIDLREQVFKCPRCRLIINRQKNAPINIYLKMKGLPYSHEWWERTVKPLLNHELWVGLPGSGARPMICSPMKGAAEVDVLQSSHRSIETYVS